MKEFTFEYDASIHPSVIHYQNGVMDDSKFSKSSNFENDHTLGLWTLHISNKFTLNLYQAFDLIMRSVHKMVKHTFKIFQH